MTEQVHVTHLGNDCFDIAVRQHHLQVDQPTIDGGDDRKQPPYIAAARNIGVDGRVRLG